VLIVEGWPNQYFCYCFANFLLSIVVYEWLSTLFLFSVDFSMFEFAQPVSLEKVTVVFTLFGYRWSNNGAVVL